MTKEILKKEIAICLTEVAIDHAPFDATRYEEYESVIDIYLDIELKPDFYLAKAREIVEDPFTDSDYREEARDVIRMIEELKEIMNG